jgi:hypothetical protein
LSKVGIFFKKGNDVISRNVWLYVTGLMNSVAREQHVARGEILNEETSFNPLPGKSEIGRRNNSENL